MMSRIQWKMCPEHEMPIIKCGCWQAQKGKRLVAVGRRFTSRDFHAEMVALFEEPTVNTPQPVKEKRI